MLTKNTRLRNENKTKEYRNYKALICLNKNKRIRLTSVPQQINNVNECPERTDKQWKRMPKITNWK